MTLDPARLDALADALEAAFPGAGPVRPLRFVGEGFSSVAVETAGGVVFRVGRIPAAAEGYRREARLLPALAPRLPVAIPDPRWHAGPSPAFPHGALGAPRLPGIALDATLLSGLDADRLASDVAAFLATLHRIPPDEARAMGFGPARAFEPRMTRLRDDSLPALRERLTSAEYAVLARWWDRFLADGRMRAYAPVPLHGDLWYDHLLVDPQRGALLAVTDWEDAALGDAAEDFGALLYLGRGFVERVLEGYRERGGAADAELRHRTARRWEAWELGGVQHAVRHDAEEMEDAVRKLRAGPLFNPAATRFG